MEIFPHPTCIFCFNPICSVQGFLTVIICRFQQIFRIILCMFLISKRFGFICWIWGSFYGVFFRTYFLNCLFFVFFSHCFFNFCSFIFYKNAKFMPPPSAGARVPVHGALPGPCMCPRWCLQLGVSAKCTVSSA